MIQEAIPIFYGIDDAYAPYLAASLTSLKAHRNPETRYEITILYQELAAVHKERMAALADDSLTIRFVSLEENLYSRFDNDKNVLRSDYFTLTIYYRLFIADMFPEYDKALYFDADTILLADAAELYSTDLKGNLVGAVADAFVCHTPIPAHYATAAIGAAPMRYVNSGVLVLDLAGLRELAFSAHFLELLNTYHFDLIAPDQDYLNAICRDRLLLLDPAWNVQTEHLLPGQTEAKLVHYNLFGKPWNYSDVPFEAPFWEFANQTAYADEIKAIKDNYSPAEIAEDNAHQAELVHKLEVLPDTECTFAKMAAKKVRIQL